MCVCGGDGGQGGRRGAGAGREGEGYSKINSGVKGTGREERRGENAGTLVNHLGGNATTGELQEGGWVKGGDWVQDFRA